MKLLLLTISALTLSLNLFSQVIFYESFDNLNGPTAGGAGTYSFPPGWLLRNVDNLTPNAAVSYVNEAWERREDFANSVIDSCAYSTSWYTLSNPADDWMWTPAIAITANCQLSWNAIALDPAYSDGYEVRIMSQSTTPGGPTGGTGVIGNQITSSTVLFSTAAENSTWTARTADLGAYSGQTVWIAYRNNSTDKFILLIDDVKVEVQIAADADLTTFTPTKEYTVTPINQVQPITYGGTIQNVGSGPLTNVQLNVDIYNSIGTNVFSGTSAPATIAAGLNSVFTLTTDFTPTSVDNYNVVAYPSANETDQNTVNDTIYSTLVISDSIYARDNQIVTGSLGIGAGNGGYLGNQFEVITADELTSVTVNYTASYSGEQYAVVIWDVVAGAPNAIVAATDTFFYADDLGGTFTLPVLGYPTLAPGEYVITAIEFDSTLQLAQTSEIFTLGKTWVNWPTNPLGTWANNEDFGASFAKSYYLRANFGTTCLPNETTNTTTICFGESITVGTNTYTISGNYSDTMNVSGCDSIIHTNLTVENQIDISTTLSNNNTTIDAVVISGAGYQWINCSDNSAIANETSSSFTPTVIGNYAVVITVNNCSDTSVCSNITTVGLNEIGKNNYFKLYPNPTSTEFNVQSELGGNFSVTNELGQKVLVFEIQAMEEKTISIAKLERGIYFVTSLENGSTQKLVIQ